MIETDSLLQDSVQKVQLPSSLRTLEPFLASYSPFDRELVKAIERFQKRELNLLERAWIAHLSAAMRQGHVCVHYDKGQVDPTPESVAESNIPVDPALVSILQRGWDALNMTLAAQGKESEETPLVKDGKRLYFRRYWNMETECIEAVQVLAKATPTLVCNIDKVNQQLEEGLSSGSLEPKQAASIAQAAGQSLCWITGGPGTGKTHTAGQLIRMLYLSCSLEAQKRFRLVLAAPTGKAATQLELSVTRAMGNLSDFPAVQGQTLHRLLSLGGSVTKERTLIHADCMLIDEASMIDMQLMNALLASIQPGTRVIMLGDADQLPAVDVGAPFADLLQVKQGIGSSMRLTKSQRTQSEELLQFARSVQTGDEPAMMQLLQDGGVGGKERAVEYIPYASIKEAKKCLLDIALPYFDWPSKGWEDVTQLKSTLQQFRLLSALREGELGVEGLNLTLHHEQVMRHKSAYPLLATRNQPDLELWNGDMGICSLDQAFFLQRGQVRFIPSFQIAGSAYGYCVSVHKSQGSEWDEVLLVLPEGSERFGRQLLYTAATRAKKKLRILSKEETLRNMVKRSHVRLSGINERMDV